MKIQLESDELIIFESSLFRTTTSLIIGDSYILLIDPNWLPIEIDFIEHKIELHGSKKEKYLLFTHSDYDHIIGYGRFKSYKTIASQNFNINNSKHKILDQIAKFDDEYYIQRDYKIEYPEIDMTISGEGETLFIGKDEYIIFQAMGHNGDGIITLNKSKGILIAGDYLSNVEFPYIYDSYINYLKTLSVFDSLIDENAIGLLVCGHGDCTRDIIEMKARVKDSEKYIMDLVDSIISNEPFDLKALFERYNFPIIMREFHENNVKLIKSELKYS